MKQTTIRVHLRTLREAALRASTSAVQNSIIYGQPVSPEPAIAAQKEGRKIAVEVKCFPNQIFARNSFPIPRDKL